MASAEGEHLMSITVLVFPLVFGAGRCSPGPSPIRSTPTATRPCGKTSVIVTCAGASHEQPSLPDKEREPDPEFIAGMTDHQTRTAIREQIALDGFEEARRKIAYFLVDEAGTEATKWQRN
jgi:hypothetical protein